MRSRTSGARRGWIAAAVAVTVLAPVTAIVVTASAASAAERPRPQADPSVPVTAVPPAPPAQERAVTERPATPVWPAAGVAEIGAGTDIGRAGGLPVRLDAAPAAAATGRPATAASRVRVEVLDRTSAAVGAGPAAVVFTVRRADGRAEPARARLAIDYSAFRNGSGADWAARLRLSAAAGRAPTVVANNLRTAVLTADVDVSGEDSVLTLAAGPAGPSGDFSATPLKSSSVWGVGGGSGDFTWSYGMRVPPGLGGPEPEVRLRYASAAVDGQIAGSNTQPSWIGEGFDWQPGHIERRYRPCGDDTGGGSAPKRGDSCWVTDNAVLSFGSVSSELLKVSADVWRLRKDDGTRVERRTTGSAAQNGDNDGEHWVVTTTDGTQYWFGRNRLPGWASGKAETNSVWTVPVYGNHANEPCHGVTFCTQGWRWNLDYVVDPHGNTATYWYVKETNVYLRAEATRTTYVRGGHLDHIDYGTRSDTAYGTAPMRVDIDVADRCLADCGTRSATTWPDTPFDLECTTSTATPCLISGPTFWTTRRLAKVTSMVRGGSAYRPVESWTLSHTFPAPGDGTRARLWLARISHTGHVGGDVAVPDVTFTGIQKPNRVDSTDFAPPMVLRRLSEIRTETGASIGVLYSNEDCVRGSRMPSAPESNSLRCFPVRWTPQGYTAPVTDYFHKYVVTAVTETDLALPSDARSVRKVTHYAYPDAPAWRYTDDDGLIDDKAKTWSVWRGYDRVVVTEGDPGEQTRTETRYFRGMHGDRLPSGTRTVTVPAAGGAPAVADEDAFAGMTREVIVYNGPTGAEVSATVNEPWQSAPTATRTISGSTVTARHTGVAAQRGRTALDGGRGVRRTLTRTTFDSSGLPIRTDDVGDEAVPDDQTCTLTTYVRNTSAWLIATVGRVQVFAVDCARATAGTGLTEDDIVSDERTSYDQAAYGVAPTRGLVSRVERLKTWTATAPTYHVVNTATHDAHGRVLQERDERGQLTVHAYTPTTGGPVAATAVTNPLGWVSRETLEPAWGVPTVTEDVNGKKTTLAYDGLGRLTKVWLPGRASPATPNVMFAYHVRANASTVVATTRLRPDGSTSTEYAHHDAHLRVRQSQRPASGAGGRVITDTEYDSVGRVVAVDGPYVADGSPSLDLALPVPDALLPAQTRTVYDGAGRETASIFLVNGAQRWRTSTAYGGDRTDVTPPAGGTPASTVVDARGRTVELRQYHAATPTGTFDATRYSYDRKGQRTAVTDPAGNRWSYSYDVRGRPTVSVDPDKGRTTTTYNDAGDVLTSTDARGRVVAYTYDDLGRRTSVRDGSATGPKRAEWTYDTVGLTGTRGQVARTTRWVGDAAYVDEVLGYDDGYRVTARSITVPAIETGLAGRYDYVYGYHVDGSPATTRLPAVGDLPMETLHHGYTALGEPNTLQTNLGGTGLPVFYINGTDYTRYGELAVLSRAYNGGRGLWTLRTYEEGTRRLDRMLTTRETEPALVADLRYSHDEAGNITRIADVPASGTGDTQCFAHDRMRRLTEAWTPGGGDCGATRAVNALGGPAPYWQSFTYDKVGNRLTSVDHGPTDTVRTYGYPAPGEVGPHAVRTVQTTGPGAGTATYTYDATGNTLTRPGPGGLQTLTWDPEGHLDSSTEGGVATRYVYDVDGNRLIARDPAGATLYLPGGQELRAAGAGVRTGARHYSHANQVVAVRTAGALTWLVPDHQGTAHVSVTATDQTVVRRYQKPFGQPRGAAAAWPGDKGFVGGTIDDTGTVHLGAREYDPVTGAFLSVDPVIDFNDPQQMHAYSYAHGSPITMSDPDGLRPWEGDEPKKTNACTGSCASYVQYYTDQAKKNSPKGKTTGGGSRRPGGIRGCLSVTACEKLGNYREPSKNCSGRASFAESRCNQVRLGNLINGSTDRAMRIAAYNKAYCEYGRYQIVCYGLSSMFLNRDKNKRADGQPMTMGDVLFYPDSESQFDGKLRAEADRRRKLQAAGFDSSEYGPNLEEHERTHSDQWAQYADEKGYWKDYGLQSWRSSRSFNNPWLGNSFEVDANLYWGGYLEVGIPDNTRRRW
jgi:RHS repeat-associated protein